MQKISSYLYPNRIQLLADLAGFTVEYTNVYQRHIKIYAGIDNTIEFDIKNADQKRIDLTTLSQFEMNVMDASGNALISSPYTIVPTNVQGIAKVTILRYDLDSLNPQYLRYSVSCIKDEQPTLLYADTRFGAVGTLELVGTAIPVVRSDRIYKDFTAEIDLDGYPISKSSAIPATFYEAEKTTTIGFEVYYTGFKGKIWIEATEQSTIAAESFKPEVRLYEFPELTSATDGTFSISLDIDDYKYFRVRYQNAKKEDVTSDNPSGLTGKVDKIIVS